MIKEQWNKEMRLKMKSDVFYCDNKKVTEDGWNKVGYIDKKNSIKNITRIWLFMDQILFFVIFREMS